MSKYTQVAPRIERKQVTTAINVNDKVTLHNRDVAALAEAKRMERKFSRRCVTVDTGKGKLTAKPETIRHILTERGYKVDEINEIMKTAK